MVDLRDDVVNALLDKKQYFIRRHLVLSSTVIELLKTREVIGHYTYTQMMVSVIIDL